MQKNVKKTTNCLDKISVHIYNRYMNAIGDHPFDELFINSLILYILYEKAGNSNGFRREA